MNASITEIERGHFAKRYE